jgi:hypothetical protein
MEDEAMIEVTGPTSHLAEIDAWAVKAKPFVVQWETSESKWNKTVWIDRDKDGLNLWANGDPVKLADDTTLPELLTVCRVLGIPLEAEGAK